MLGNIYDDKFYTLQATTSYRSAQAMMPLVLDLLEVKSVVDVGCGAAAFLRVLAENGVEDFLGVDGEHVRADQLLVGYDRFRPVDLGQPFDLGRRFDMAMSLEVAEHLWPDRAASFVSDLCALSDVILFSGASPFQGGAHHVNEQWASYWVEKFAACGFRHFDALRPLLWNRADVDVWFKQNTLIFANAAGIERNPKLKALAQQPVEAVRDLVHPEMYMNQVNQLANQAKFFEQVCNSGSAYRFRRQEDGRIVADQVG